MPPKNSCHATLRLWGDRLPPGEFLVISGTRWKNRNSEMGWWFKHPAKPELYKRLVFYPIIYGFSYPSSFRRISELLNGTWNNMGKGLLQKKDPGKESGSMKCMTCNQAVSRQVELWIPSRELTYPTLGKGTSSSKMPFLGDMLVPRSVLYFYRFFHFRHSIWVWSSIVS